MPNTDKEFWNDANVIDFAYSVRHNENFKDGIALSKGTIEELAKEFKRGKETNKDYEILTVKGVNSDRIIEVKYMGMFNPDYFKIHSVKRLSDNEVFSVGEKVNYGEIEKFFIGWAGMEVHFTDGCGATLRSIERKKQPLFTTEDKVDIFEGDEYVKVNDYSDYSIVTGFTAHGNHNDYKGIRFSTKEAANEYAKNNMKRFSIIDLKSVFGNRDFIGVNFLLNELEYL